MPMKPHAGESQSAFMGRCVPEMVSTGENKRPNEQAVAICLDIWRQAHGGKKPAKGADEVKRIIAVWCRMLAKQADVPEPDDDESREEFLDRCMDEVDDEEACQMAWDDKSGDDGIVRKMSAHPVTKSDDAGDIEFVLSDATVDRFGEVVEPAGWQVENFKRNPVALFAHDSRFIIGTWKDLRTDSDALRARLAPAPWGTSARIDEIRRLIDANILKAVSVGFKALDSEPMDPKSRDSFFGPQRFTKQELVECSLVAIPANPNAMAVAKSLNISPATLDLVFAKHGTKDGSTTTRSLPGKHAATSRNRGGGAMSLAQRISDTQIAFTAKKDELDEHWKNADQSDVSDADLEKANKLNAELALLAKQLESLMASERFLAGTVDGASNGHSRALATTTAFTQPHRAANGGNGIASPAIIATRQKDLDPLDYVIRAGRIVYGAKIWNQPHDEVRLKVYGEDEGTKVVTDLMTKAASAPAMTTVTGWAAELVQQVYVGLMELLMPKAIYTRLAAKGLSLTFGTAGKIVIPTRSRTPTIAGSFVGEGQAIPVRQGAFTSQTLVPKKMAVITTWTREMSDHSTPQIEGVLRDAIQVDTTVAMDSVLIDTNPATTIRPAGLLNGVAALTATAGGGITAIIGDIKQLINALSTNTYGNIRTPVWLMNQTDMLAASLLTAPNTGIFPFREEVRGGTLNTIPIIDSATVPAKTMILVDAADFVSVGGDTPRFELSDQATLHFEDAAPADLVSGSPGVVATPQKSLWQTDSIALRLILPTNWVQRRAGTVAWTQNVSWA